MIIANQISARDGMISAFCRGLRYVLEMHRAPA
jgi:hypothetical protein